ncbi:GNAT family N-acetyltransferase [Natronolimnohabitans innermongolicus]|uniref:N-acetyltransferase GCN5 n=1 Tax=Natronolimnohabitans innermongolicus JCM 12255 TaxID=1227499 RepID=L9X7I0_9EURY|nr:GNAT family N-acetyltransferase [Natronolimnohabitans innermongolicus]ELY57734.1 N-acetyltransferase GCN5 [Natronolimnohabitans innermongolicus JCM 12255]
MGDVEIRELESEAEWIDAYPLMNRLYPDVDEAQYLEYLAQMTADGYRLFGLFSDGELAALAGATILTNMYYGRHLWVYDLVTDPDHRSKGYGARFFRYLVEWAEKRGCETVALSSGLQRERAHRFYEERTELEKDAHVFTLDLS